MINKNTLQSAIQKYYIAGRHNKVKWKVKDNTLTVYAGESGKACKVVLNNFPLQDSELGIFDTDKLIRLLAITSGDLILTLQGQKELQNLWIADPDTFEVEINLEKEHIHNIVKAKSALSESPNMLITTNLDIDNNQVCEFIFGDMSGYANKISYKLYGIITKNDISIPFDAELIKDIFNVNKDIDVATLKLSDKGLLKLVFQNKDIESTYYILRNE